MTTDVQQQPADESNQAVNDELATLRARADLMGITYHQSTGVDKLRARINNTLQGEEKAESAEPVNKTAKAKTVEVISEKQFKEEEFRLRKSNAGKLMRVRVTCMNPAKKEWDGEIISVGSSKIGTYKKFVKFNAEDGWHIPYIIYQYMKEKKCSVFYTVTDQRGQKIRKAKLVNEFNMEVLPSLTDDELKALAQQQAMEAGKEA